MNEPSKPQPLAGLGTLATVSPAAIEQRAAIETIETRATMILRARGIDPAPWLAKARADARWRASGATWDPMTCQLVTVSYVEALDAAVAELARKGGAP